MTSEKDLDDYYYAKGKAYARAHVVALPRLLVGRLTRAYVPVPWVPDLAAYGASLVRFALLLAFFATIGTWRPKSGSLFNVFLVSIIAANVANVLIFYGSVRFAFVMEVFFIPCAAYAVSQRLGKTNALPSAER